MKLELTIPEGHRIAVESGSATKDGSRHWRVWIARDNRDLLKGAADFDPQIAINKAVEALHQSERDFAPVPDTRFAGLQLNLNILGNLK